MSVWLRAGECFASVRVCAGEDTLLAAEAMGFLPLKEVDGSAAVRLSAYELRFQEGCLLPRGGTFITAVCSSGHREVIALPVPLVSGRSQSRNRLKHCKRIAAL